MFKTFINAFKVKELRQKLLYTFFVLIVVRLGSLITVPGIRADAIKEYLSNALGDSFNLFSSFTGGSFDQMSIFALNVTPYITASIIIQLLTKVTLRKKENYSNYPFFNDRSRNSGKCRSCDQFRKKRIHGQLQFLDSIDNDRYPYRW